MSTTGSWTGWRSNDNGRSSYCIGQHNNLDLGSSYTSLVSYIDMTGAERAVVSIRNTSTTSGYVKIYTTECTPTISFTEDEWDLEPAGSIFTLGSVGSTSDNRLKKSVIGPVRYLALVGSAIGGTATTTGSVTIITHLLG